MKNVDLTIEKLDLSIKNWDLTFNNGDLTIKSGDSTINNRYVMIKARDFTNVDLKSLFFLRQVVAPFYTCFFHVFLQKQGPGMTRICVAFGGQVPDRVGLERVINPAL